MPMLLLPESVTLRPIAPDDASFLSALYASTREEELRIVPWSAEQKAAFLQMQFQAQHDYYQQNYVDTAFDLIQLDGTNVGRLYVSRWPHEMRIVDIALMPDWRGRGIGGALLRALQDEARETARPLTIHVERNNPALRLYERLGFAMREDKGVYLFLEWRS
jgi:ribosomal protein S18 acetylase RimI-like enzyme